MQAQVAAPWVRGWLVARVVHSGFGAQRRPPRLGTVCRMAAARAPLRLGDAGCVDTAAVLHRPCLRSQKLPRDACCAAARACSRTGGPDHVSDCTTCSRRTACTLRSAYSCWLMDRSERSTGATLSAACSISHCGCSVAASSAMACSVSRACVRIVAIRALLRAALRSRNATCASMKGCASSAVHSAQNCKPV